MKKKIKKKKKTNKKKGKTGDKEIKTNSVNYVLTSVKVENVRDFVSELLLKHMTSASNTARAVVEAGMGPNVIIDTDTGAPIATTPLTIETGTTTDTVTTTSTLSSLSLASASSSTPVVIPIATAISTYSPPVCHPPLKHWGEDDIAVRGLGTSNGYKQLIFLSERTKVKACVRIGGGSGGVSNTTSLTGLPNNNNGTTNNGEEIVLFVVCRCEYTSMARFEYLYHGRIVLDSDENVGQVCWREKKSWTDGEVERWQQEQVFDDWLHYVGVEDEMEELSIPPIV